ncbi:MAG: helix-turn-helix domain-containing protein [Spirochaetales bacterium]|nr:helix-turn-helix domain-containing protein [Spirochaetales bacterium]
MSITHDIIRKWCKRYTDSGIDGLFDEIRQGKPRSISDESAAELIKKTLETVPKGSTHWSFGTMAEETGISKSTVQRIWSA